MNALASSIVALVESQALSYLVSSERKQHPDLSGDALVEAVLSDAHHWLRTKISFLVDLLWPAVEGTLRTAIQTEIALESGSATS